MQYDPLIDKHARKCSRAPEWEVQSFFRQLQSIFVVHLPTTRDLNLNSPVTLILAAIHLCHVNAHDDLDIHYYEDMGRTEVVDITTLQCVVAQVKLKKTGKHWAILDHSGTMAHGFYDPELESM